MRKIEICKLDRMRGFFLFIFLCSISWGYSQKEKPQVFIFTDINLVGGDPDDRQSLVHLLWYADELNIKGIVADYWTGKGGEACQEVIEAYQSDYQTYGWANMGYPHPDTVSQWVIGTEESAIDALKDAAVSSQAPLYVLVWGSMKTIGKALDRYPGLVDDIRLLTIGTGLKYGPKDEVAGEDCHAINWNGRGRNDLYNDPRFDSLWWLESNWTYNGMFMGNEPKQMLDTMVQYGAMGRRVKLVTSKHKWAQYFRAGDTPTVLYVLDPNHPIDDPTLSSWAGLFTKPFPEKKPNYYTDDHGHVTWNYHDPCQSWGNLKEMYAYNKQTLVNERSDMYRSIINKLHKIYNQ